MILYRNLQENQPTFIRMELLYRNLVTLEWNCCLLHSQLNHRGLELEKRRSLQESWSKLVERERERRRRIERNWFFSIFLYHYLNKKGYSYTAQIFRYEVQITQQTPPGMYASFWEMNYFLKLKKRSCVLQEKKYLIHKTITLPFL
jgi:hypothetical protein